MFARLRKKEPSPITRRRWRNFKANKRGYWSLWIFIVLMAFTLPAEFISNDKPLLVEYKGHYYFPIFKNYPESTFGGFLAETDYRDDFIKKEIESNGWMIWPPFRYSYDTINRTPPTPAPSPPSLENPLGTDDQSRDVLARVIYGFRISVLFGITLTFFSTIIGVLAGAVQGYFGGLIDLTFQRIMEIWSSTPSLYVIIIVGAIFQMNFVLFVGLTVLFGWMGLVGLVRAEFLRARNFEYVRAARALGVGDRVIMFRHLLPNAMVSATTMMPFVVIGAISTLTGLDYLGYGLPASYPSLGELAAQAQQNLQAPHLTFAAFTSTGLMLCLLIFIFEGVRDAFDPRKTFQ